MRRSLTSFISVVLGLAAAPTLATTSYAHYYSRTYVSTSGSDSNYCSINDPCRTFQRAFDRSFMNGEINCLDAGGYGTVVITHSITIDCKEVPASINAGVANGIGITINIPAGNAADPLRSVRLRGFTISGAGQPSGTTDPTTLGTRIGTRGIAILAASDVYIEHVVISDFTVQAILDTRSVGPTKLFIIDTVTRNNAGSAIVPLVSSTNATTVLDNVRSEGNGYGLAVGPGNSVMANRSVFSGNSGGGVEVDVGGFVNVSNSVISNNGHGVDTNGTMRLFNNDIAFNTLAFYGAPARSFGSNRVSGNTTTGTLPIPISAAAVDIVQ